MTRRRLLSLGAVAALPGTLAACASGYAERAEARFPPLGRAVEAEGLRIQIMDEGDGPPVVAIHGVNQTMRDFAFSMTGRLAAAGYRAVAVDRPGQGYSERPAQGGASLGVQARILHEAVAAAGVEQPILLGHSFGAAVALAWALQAPEQVRGLVLVSGSYYPFQMDSAPAIFRVFQLARRPLLDGPIAFGFRLMVDEDQPADLLAQMFAPNDPPEGYGDVVGVPLMLRTDALRHNAEDLTSLPESLAGQADAYPSLRLPVEILHGAADAGLPVAEQAGRLAVAIPGARFTMLEGVGHMAHHAAEAEILAAVDRIAAETAPPE